VVDSAPCIKLKGGYSRPADGNRRTVIAHCRRYSLFRADRHRLVAPCKESAVHILYQSGVRVDDCRLDIRGDMDDGRTE
jgi:hypothetical protein